MSRWVCGICGYIYDEEKEGTPFGELPEGWVCPLCGADRSVFARETAGPAPAPAPAPADPGAGGEELRTSRDLLRVRRHSYLGDQLPVTLWRDGALLEVTLDLRDGA